MPSTGSAWRGIIAPSSGSHEDRGLAGPAPRRYAVWPSAPSSAEVPRRTTAGDHDPVKASMTSGTPRWPGFLDFRDQGAGPDLVMIRRAGRHPRTLDEDHRDQMLLAPEGQRRSPRPLAFHGVTLTLTPAVEALLVGDTPAHDDPGADPAVAAAALRGRPAVRSGPAPGRRKLHFLLLGLVGRGPPHVVPRTFIAVCGELLAVPQATGPARTSQPDLRALPVDKHPLRCALPHRTRPTPFRLRGLPPGWP